MSFVTLEEAKDQCAVDHDVTLHDARLNRLIASAETWASNFLNRPLSDLVESGSEVPTGLDGIIPEDVKSGILLRVEFEFDPDAQKDATMEAAERTLWPYRVEVSV